MVVSINLLILKLVKKRGNLKKKGNLKRGGGIKEKGGKPNLVMNLALETFYLWTQLGLK